MNSVIQLDRSDQLGHLVFLPNKAEERCNNYVSLFSELTAEMSSWVMVCSFWVMVCPFMY